MRRLIFLCILCGACAGRAHTETATDPTRASIVEALRRILADSERISIRVDPERLPIGLDAAGSDSGNTATNGPVSHMEQAMDISQVALRAEPEPVRNACRGTTVPAAPDEADPHRGCPSTRAVLVVVGRPRVVSQACPTDGRVTAATITATACATVRALVTHIGRKGFNTALADYAFARSRDGDWILVGTSWLSSVE